MKLLNAQAETRVLKTICDGGDKMASRILNVVGDETFYHPPNKEAWRRIRSLLRAHGEIPSWADLVADPAIPEQHRTILARDPQKPMTPALSEKLELTLKLLDDFRQMRALLDVANEVMTSLEDDKVDVQALLDSAGDKLMAARTKADAKSKLMHFGRGNNTTNLMKELLTGVDRPVIPTGFKAFDSVNGGILRGSLFIVAANTGGGKSTMAINLANNMSVGGFDVCVVPLEMTEDQMAARLFGLRTELDVGKISQHKLAKGEKKKVVTDYKKFVGDLKKNDTRLTMFAPEEDMSIEEILLMLKPYRYDVIVIDYISLLRGADDDDQAKKLGAIARYAKVFAKNNNCFAGSEKFLTKEYGNVTFDSVVGQKVTVLTRKGWKSAQVKSFGKQQLQMVTMKPMHWHSALGKFVRTGRSSMRHRIECTPDHRWILQDGNVTTSLKVGDTVRSQGYRANTRSREYLEGLRHGVIFGDGTDEGFKPEKGHFSNRVTLCGAKIEKFKHLFKHFRSPTERGDEIAVHYTKTSYKQLPDADSTPDYKAGFIAGWFGTDGSTDRNGAQTISSQDITALDWLVENAPFGGFVATGRRVDTAMKTNLGRRKAPLGLVALKPAEQVAWYVDSIEATRSAPVYCAVVPGEQSFTLSSGVYTGNCVVILLAQLDDKTKNIRYARAIREHANNAWFWFTPEEEQEQTVLDIRQTKARNQKRFNFELLSMNATMLITDVDEEHRGQSDKSETKAKTDDYIRDLGEEDDEDEDD